MQWTRSMLPGSKRSPGSKRLQAQMLEKRVSEAPVTAQTFWVSCESKAQEMMLQAVARNGL